jgi:ketosteroid isomerase-like protein
MVNDVGRDDHGSEDLRDRAEITDVLTRYADGMRLGDVEALVSCFTDDTFADYGHVTMRGAEEVREYFARISTPPPPDAAGPRMFDTGRISTPVITNVLIELHGDEAHCESMCLAIHAGRQDGEGRVVFRGTRNIDEFSKTAVGWRIAERRHETLWSFEVPGNPVALSD